MITDLRGKIRRPLAVIACLTLWACDPVVPLVELDDWQFEGYQVYSHVPEEPVGAVYLVHGSGGSAEFARRLETTDAGNELLARGYALIATESTDRTTEKRWAVQDPSLSGNPDLGRLARLHAELVRDTALTENTPIFGIGMSNGARMVTLFGQSFSDAGYPVAAIAAFMGRAAGPVRSAGGLRIPALFVLAENDGVVNNESIRLDYVMAVANGVPSELLVKAEEPLLPLRFTRIPELTAEDAVRLTYALQQTGAWNSSGQRVVSVQEAIDAYPSLVLPEGTAPSYSEITNQVRAILGLHQFVGFFRVQVADFFDAQLAP